jgi:prepilin-type N-terminal cleavage/methylation domain-containing protein
MHHNHMTSERGFTLIELMIVVAVIGILAAIAIPNFLNLKDKAIWGTARANLEAVRTSLAAYSADSNQNRYPLGTLDFAAFKSAVPKANLPASESLAKLRGGTFSYASADGSTFTVSARADNRAYDHMVASPNGITPANYEDYVR